MRNRLACVLSTFAVVIAPAVVARGEETILPPAVADEVVPITFTTGNGWQYDGRIELPPAARRRDWGVMILGGGMGTSIDWLVTGALTIDRNPTRDGDTIARALLNEGFVVMRWHAIRRGDPLHAKDPLMLDAPPPPQTVEQARLAFEAFNKKKIVPPEHVFLLGHSLGARRASILTEKHPRIAGMVMLAGAALIPSDLVAAREIVRQASAESEVAERKKLGIEDVHEFRVQRLQASRDRWFKGIAGTGDRWGGRWPADLIVENKTPTLLVAGALD